MDIKIGFNKNYNKWFLKDVLRAIKKYSLIENGERVCVALSGGKDSITLTYILSYINRYSYLKFDLSAVHIKTDDYDTSVLKQFCETLEIEYLEDRLVLERETPDKNICYLCARLKRGAIAKLLERHAIGKVAYGHHADDVAETFFMNILQNQKLGSFSPRVEVSESPMVIIRPLICLEEAVISRLHRHVGLPAFAWKCRYAEKNLRSQYKQSIAQLNNVFHTSGFARKVVESLENIDFTNIWSESPTNHTNIHR